VVAPLLQAKPRGAVPPFTVRFTLPLVAPLQVTFQPPATVGLAMLEVNTPGCVSVMLVVAWQPLASVTTTL
jgi:hypothetical protein